MILARSRSEVASTRVPTQMGRFATDFFGVHRENQPGPQAYMVETPPGGVIKPHFHGANQYQLTVAGEGTIGKIKLVPGALHYADAYTPYGPILSGPQGLTFVTLRQSSYVGSHYMPGSKEQQRQKTGRNVHSAVDLQPTGKAGASKLDEREDGVAIYRLEAPAGGQLPLPDVDHGGAFLIVLTGELRFEGMDYPAISCLFATAGSKREKLVAGAEGAVVAFLSYPRLETERGLPAREALAAGR
jgi:hypothetical protein